MHHLPLLFVDRHGSFSLCDLFIRKASLAVGMMKENRAGKRSWREELQQHLMTFHKLLILPKANRIGVFADISNLQ
jgi:hypothetical protein